MNIYGFRLKLIIDNFTDWIMFHNHSLDKFVQQKLFWAYELFMFQITFIMLELLWACFGLRSIFRSNFLLSHVNFVNFQIRNIEMRFKPSSDVNKWFIYRFPLLDSCLIFVKVRLKKVTSDPCVVNMSNLLINEVGWKNSFDPSSFKMFSGYFQFPNVFIIYF